MNATLGRFRTRIEAALAKVGIKGRVLPVVGVGAGVVAAYAAVALLHRSGTAPTPAAPGAIGTDWSSGLAGGLGLGDNTTAPGTTVTNAGPPPGGGGFDPLQPPGPAPAPKPAPAPIGAGQSTGNVAPTSYGAPIASHLATTPGTSTPTGGLNPHTLGSAQVPTSPTSGLSPHTIGSRQVPTSPMSGLSPHTIGSRQAPAPRPPSPLVLPGHAPVAS